MLSTPTVEFDFYMEHPSVTALSTRDVNAWREQYCIDVPDSRAPKPVRTFLEAAFPEYLTAECEASGFNAPTPIQSQAWPTVLKGLDIIGLASTGSGKTLGFTLPAIVHINAQDYLQAGDGPIALMLAPTRELAVQIKEECDKFGASSGIKNVCVHGGVPKGPQLRDLQQGAEICIATPGRLLDFLEGGQTNMRRMTFLVLDEADRMLDLGFEPQLKSIMTQVRTDRQTLMWSATWPREVENLAREFLNRPVMVQVNNASKLTTNANITQHFAVCGDAEKHGVLLGILRTIADGSAKNIIFCASKRGCESLRTDLKRRGFEAESIHGDKSQQERDWVMQQFKGSGASLLIATDVASRGIDVKDVRAVVNYDAPSQAEDYVHRIGRAGRGGATGESFTILTAADAPFAREVAMMQRRSGVPVSRELLRFTASEGRGDRGDRGDRYGDRGDRKGGGDGHRRWRS